MPGEGLVGTEAGARGPSRCRARVMQRLPRCLRECVSVVTGVAGTQASDCVVTGFVLCSCSDDTTVS